MVIRHALTWRARSRLLPTAVGIRSFSQSSLIAHQYGEPPGGSPPGPSAPSAPFPHPPPPPPGASSGSQDAPPNSAPHPNEFPGSHNYPQHDPSASPPSFNSYSGYQGYPPYPSSDAPNAYSVPPQFPQHSSAFPSDVHPVLTAPTAPPPPPDAMSGSLDPSLYAPEEEEAPHPDQVRRDWNQFQHFKATTGKLGSKVGPHYQPSLLVRHPPSPQDITLSLLLASQAHLGHAISLWNPSNQRYIFGVRQGIHIISLEIIAAHLRRAAKIVEGVAEKGGLILFVGTRPGQDRAVVGAAKMAGGCHLFERWTPGAITNASQILGRGKVVEMDMRDRVKVKSLDPTETTGGQSKPALDVATGQTVKPDLVVCLNPLENYILLHECGLYAIPTIGVIDTDADPTWVTYPIPANDDSLRAMNLIAGILGRAAQAGRNRRIRRAEREAAEQAAAAAAAAAQQQAMADAQKDQSYNEDQEWRYWEETEATSPFDRRRRGRAGRGGFLGGGGRGGGGATWGVGGFRPPGVLQGRGASGGVMGPMGPPRSLAPPGRGVPSQGRGVWGSPMRAGGMLGRGRGRGMPMQGRGGPGGGLPPFRGRGGGW